MKKRRGTLFEDRQVDKKRSAATKRLLALLVLFSLVAAACGSSDSDDDTTTASEAPTAVAEAEEDPPAEDEAAAESDAGAATGAGSVVIAQPAWSGAQIISHVLAEVIEGDLGGEVDFAPGTNAVIFEAMDGGRGDIDVHPDVWLPNQASFTSEYVDANGTVSLSNGSYEGNAGFCVPRYVAEDEGVTSIFDLATPDAQALFDSDGDGQGEIWIGAAGWASTNINTVKMRDYGIESFLEPGIEDEAVFIAALEPVIEAGQPAVFYCFAPHYIHALHDLVKLEEPTFDPAQYTMVNPDEDSDWLENSSIFTGDEPKEVHVGYSTSLNDRAPAIAEFLANVNLDNAAVSAMTFEVVVQERDPAEVAAEWIAANRDVVDAWLGI